VLPFQVPDISGDDSSGVKLHLCLEPSFPGVAPHRTTEPSCGCSTTRTSGDDCWLNARFARSWLLLLSFFGVGFFQAKPIPVATTAKAAATPTATPTAVDLSEYCNASTSTCFLCSRQLKSVELLERHVRESDLHKARTSFLQSGPNRVSLALV
jgi:hypothetical protein